MAICPRSRSRVATIAALLVIIASYFIADRRPGSRRNAAEPPLVAFLLVANLVPAIGLLVLLGRRVAMRRAASIGRRRTGGCTSGWSRSFRCIAAVPTLLVVIFASLLFQYGVEFWFSDRARGMLENASIAGAASPIEHKQLDQVDAEIGHRWPAIVGGSCDTAARSIAPRFVQASSPAGLPSQSLRRRADLGHAENGVQSLIAIVNPDERDAREADRSGRDRASCESGKPSVVDRSRRPDRGRGAVPDPRPTSILYAARDADPQMPAAMCSAREACSAIITR